MTLLLLLTACRPDPAETWRAAQLEAERGRAAVASADDVCRQIYRCEEARTRLLRAEAAGEDELEASGLVNMMAPECQACEEEATRRGLRCRRVER
jgi:hypothetical protein